MNTLEHFPACIGRKTENQPVQVASRTHSAVLLCEKKSEFGSLLTLCVFRVWSHKPSINAQHGTPILPAVQRPRDSLSQPLSFTVRCPLSVSLRHSQKDNISPPPVTVPLSHALLRLLLAGALVWAPVLQADPALHPLAWQWWWQEEHQEKEVQEEKEEERTTALDLKKQQLQQPHCHSNICFMLSAAAGQLKAWEPQNCCSVASLAQRTGLILFRAATINSLFN